MKVAVLGPSSSALQIAQKLHELGAAVRLFWPMTGEVPAAVLELQRENVVIGHPWVRVTKRFLTPGSVPAGKSRFVDLFRVAYQVDPTPIIEKGKVEQPEVYEKMTEDFLSSLTGNLEMFEDVDVVIDAAEAIPRGTMGPGGQAVGESKLREGTHVVMTATTRLAEFVGEAREIALVGAGTMAQAAIVQLASWLERDGHRLFVMTSETKPFATDSLQSLRPILEREAFHHAQAVSAFTKAEAEWLELDDFIKAKKPRPEMPIPRLVVFSGHVVTAADQLVDRTRTFLTCETLPWAPGEVQPENNGLELKTIGVDKVIVATGTRRSWERFAGLDLLSSPDGKDARALDGSHPEKGFFTLPESADSSARQLEIVNALEKLFSRVGA